MITLMFPGQGAQHKGMGLEVFDLFPNEMKQAKAILGYELKELCEQSGPRLNDTAYTQPALYTVSALMQMDMTRRSGVRPDYVIGHSLGEYNALLCAGVFDFQTGLELVKKRGELMARENGKGSMIAVLDPDHAVLKVIASELGDDFCIANDNAPSQVVCAGSVTAINIASKQISARNAGKVIPLKVSGAFHTHFMADAAEQFQQYCRQGSFKAPQLPVISNQSALPHDNAGWAEKLAKHLTSPVQWRQSLFYLAQRGPMLFQEVGPGSILTSLAKSNFHI